MDPLTIAAIIGGGANTANSFLTAGQSKKNLKREMRYSRQAADLQHERNIALWRMQSDRDLENWHLANEYNSPKNQMARLREAGINPRLVFGSSGATGGMATAMKTGSPGSYKYNVPDFSQRKPLQIPDGLGSYFDLKLKKAQVDAIEQQTSLNQQKEANEAVENAIKTAESRNALGYYAQRRQKMHYDARQSFQKGQLGAHSTEVAIEKLEQAKLDTAKKAQEVELTAEQVLAQQIKNDYEQRGLSPNSPYQAKLLYKQLKKSGMNDDQITTTLLTAGVSADVLKNVVPAGILGGALKRMKSGKPGSKPGYNSAESWRRLQRRYDGR